jgi:hypothetical protein
LPIISSDDTIDAQGVGREGSMGKRPSVWVLANSGEEIDQKENLEKSAVFLLLMSDKVPREWGDRPRKVPAPALHDARIQLGIGLTGHDSPEANQHYVAIQADTVHFNNPRRGYVACHELTAEGKRWAEALLAEAEEGRKPWLLDWRS